MCQNAQFPALPWQVRTWSEVYSSVIEDTKGYVEKKQASTYEELVAEQELKADEVILQILRCCDTS